MGRSTTRFEEYSSCVHRPPLAATATTRRDPLAQPRADEPCSPVLTCKALLAYGRSVGDVFKALADPTRRAILDELGERDPQTLFELCSRLITKHDVASSRQAVSQHLDVLEDAGLVKTRREGRCKFHHLDRRPLERLADRWLQQPPEDP